MTAIATRPAMQATAEHAADRRPSGPRPGESQPDFAVRFHREAAASIPGTDERNAAMWSAWCAARGEDRLDRIAAKLFGADHERKAFLPLFDAHTARNRDGSTSHYDLAALRAIVAQCNRRILDTGDFAPLIDGHTPDAKDGAQPDVLGWVGPFRLGMIGNVEPHWCIFADEWHDRTEGDRLRKLRRRSPEVWLEPDMRDRFFDPVAALGAETPRRDLGVARLSRARSADGRLVEKYAAMAPGAVTTFVPGIADRKRKCAADPAPQLDTGGKAMNLSEEDIQKILAALLNSELMQFVQQLKDEHEAASGEGGDPDAGAPDIDGDEAGDADADEMVDAIGPHAPEDGTADEPDDYAATPAGNRAMWAKVDAAGGRAKTKPKGQKHRPYKKSAMRGKWPNPADHDEYAADRDDTETLDDDAPPTPPADDYEPDDDDRDMVRKYVAGEVSDDEMQRYMAAKRSRYGAATAARANYSRRGTVPGGTSKGGETMADRIAAEKYQRSLRRENAALVARVEKLERDKTSAERYARLQALSDEVALDLAEEAERCDPAKMPDAAFDDHLKVIAEHYQRIPLASGVPRVRTEVAGGAARAKRRDDDFDADLAKRAVERYQLARAAGKSTSYDQCLADAEKELLQTA